MLAAGTSWFSVLARLIDTRRKHWIRARVYHLISFLAQHRYRDQRLISLRNAQHLLQCQNARIAHIIYAMQVNITRTNCFHHCTFLGNMHRDRCRLEVLEIRRHRVHVPIGATINAPLGLEDRRITLCHHVEDERPLLEQV